MLIDEVNSMLNNLWWMKLTGAWIAALAVIGAVGTVSGMPMTIGSLALLLASSVVPPAVMCVLARSESGPNIAEVLRATNAAEDARP